MVKDITSQHRTVVRALQMAHGLLWRCGIGRARIHGCTSPGERTWRIILFRNLTWKIKVAKYALSDSHFYIHLDEVEEIGGRTRQML